VVTVALESPELIRPRLSQLRGDFSIHRNVYIRSVWTLMMRKWRDSDENERKLMEGIAPHYFADVGQALTGSFAYHEASLALDQSNNIVRNRHEAFLPD
jgi:hypothetical protein